MIAKPMFISRPRFCRPLFIGVLALTVSCPSFGLDVYPADVKLDHSRDPQGLVLVHTREDGVTLDVTQQATVSLSADGVTRWEAEKGVFEPVADGEVQATFTYEGETVTASIRVAHATQSPAISFRNDVEAVLMKSGCNRGSCHGSARGKNGFRLSLFGYDPDLDYMTLTREIRGRRLNAAVPTESLTLLKPTGKVFHDGGSLFKEDSHLYKTVLQWIEEGAQEDPADLRSLTGLEILPEACVLEGKGATQRFTVRATYSDGTDRDVTQLAILSTSDDSTIKVDDEGRVTAGARGEAYILARFGSFAVVSQAIVLPKDLALDWPEIPVKNYVDERVFAKLKRLRVPPAEVCSDEVFARRVYIDTLGRLPTAEEARTFLADAAPAKRDNLVDALLTQPEFIDVWSTKWADLIKVRSDANLDRKAMHRYNDWLRQSISSNKPIGQMVTELVSAQGGTFSNPAANYFSTDGSVANVYATNVARVFLGLQIQCAECHNHPFERWTMDDYYSFSAFFAQLGRKASDDPREKIIFNQGSGEVKNKRDGTVAKPKFLGGEYPDTAGKDRRAVLAEWLTAPENPWFAKNIANRTWQHFFGTGIFDPVDDVRVTNPASHPQLLEDLADHLVAYDFDLRKLIRDIATSTSYQLSTRPRVEGQEDRRNFSCASVRRMPSEQLLDAISDVTQTKVKFSNLPLGSRALQVADGKSGNYFLGLFGRPPRETVHACERRSEPTLAQALHLINGDSVESAIRNGEGRLARLVSSTTDENAIIDELYLAAFARFPTEKDKDVLLAHVAGAENRQERWEDVFWSVLNSKEFLFNH